jgi:hypothetical protein
MKSKDSSRTDTYETDALLIAMSSNPTIVYISRASANASALETALTASAPVMATA